VFVIGALPFAWAPAASWSPQMGFGDTSKKDKKAVAAGSATAAAEAAKEDAEWAEGGKKASKKKEAEEAKKEARSARKAEADEQLKQEEAEISTPRGTKEKKKAAGGKKLTQAQIAEKAMAAMKAKEKEEKQRKIDIQKSGGNDYIGVLMENDNRSQEIDASGVDAAIDALSMGEPSSSGGVAKVSKKAAYAAFEERELARLKEENAGLKLSQYKEQVHKLWAKSPENPDNQAVELS